MRRLSLPAMKIGEWDGIGRARGMIAYQLGELGAAELAAHVTIGENQRLRILVATDIGLLDFTWGSSTTEPDAVWNLRGSLTRWHTLRGLRLQIDAQFDPVYEKVQSVWRLVAEEPKIELSANTEAADVSVPALLAFAHACLEHTA
jgi:hypothetical protein